MSAADASADDVVAFADTLHHDGHPNPTICRKVEALRTFFNFLTHEKIVAHDPTRHIAMPPYLRELPTPLTPMDVRGIINSIRGEDFFSVRDRAIIEMLNETGIKVGELTALSVKDVDLEKNEICARGARGRVRYVNIGEVAHHALSPLVEHRKDSVEALFCNKNRGRLTQRSVNRILAKRADAAGLGDLGISAQTFRHTTTMRLMAEGKSLKEIRERMGHAEDGSLCVSCITITGSRLGATDAGLGEVSQVFQRSR